MKTTEGKHFIRKNNQYTRIPAGVPLYTGAGSFTEHQKHVTFLILSLRQENREAIGTIPHEPNTLFPMLDKLPRTEMLAAQGGMAHESRLYLSILGAGLLAETLHGKKPLARHSLASLFSQANVEPTHKLLQAFCQKLYSQRYFHADLVTPHLLQGTHDEKVAHILDWRKTHPSHIRPQPPYDDENYLQNYGIYTNSSSGLIKSISSLVPVPITQHIQPSIREYAPFDISALRPYCSQQEKASIIQIAGSYIQVCIESIGILPPQSRYLVFDRSRYSLKLIDTHRTQINLETEYKTGSTNLYINNA